MNRRFLCLASALGLVLGTWVAGAQEPKTTTEKIKEKASGAVQSLNKGITSAEEGLREQFHKVRTAAANMSLHGRVYTRLHWDKGLADAKIETEVTDNGVTTLRGTVPDARAKAKALQLATDTVGVTKVIDGLTIGLTTRTTTTTTETKVETRP